MAEKCNPVTLTAEEAAKIDPAKIGKSAPAGEGEVEAQDYTVTCTHCGYKFWNRLNFQYTMCPKCGTITKWW